MTKRLPPTESAAIGVKHRRASWSMDRRARQAALIRRWAPWRRSTGPKTEAGKARAAASALKHGMRSRNHIHTRRRARQILRVAAGNLLRIKAFLRAPACSPITYKLRLAKPKRGEGWFRPQLQERRMTATYRHASREDHRWPSASR